MCSGEHQEKMFKEGINVQCGEVFHSSLRPKQSAIGLTE